ncbi:MAG: hypothetical protein RL559_1471 [Pseudomonadota bacterium]|jgi:predicted alpha/beta hydrolase family esterase
MGPSGQPSDDAAHWSPAHAQRLRALMQEKGWDAPRLAVWAALSLRQVQALCEDEATPHTAVFYTEQIKRHAGLRLIDKLTQRG